MQARPHYVFKMDRGRPSWHIYESRDGCLLGVRQSTSPLGVPVEKPLIDLPLAQVPALREKTITDLIQLWRSPNPQAWSPEWRALAPNTRRTWGGALNRIDLKWGLYTLKAFNDPTIKAEIVAWRDSYAHRPRGADIGVVVLQALLRFGLLRGLVRSNVANGIPSLYHGGDRAEIVWTDEELYQMATQARRMGLAHAVDALRLAAACGLRRDDLVTLTWEHIGEFAICKKARKSSRRRRRYVSIPRIPELDALLEELRARPRQDGIHNVLVDRHGMPWRADWLTRQVSKVRDTLDIAHLDPETGLRRKKHLHDARGTYATRLIRQADLADEAVADIMGWSPAEVARIRRVYVDQKMVTIAIGERIRRKWNPLQPNPLCRLTGTP